MQNGRWHDFVCRMKIGSVALIGFCFIAIGLMVSGEPGHGLAFSDGSSQKPDRVAATAKSPAAETSVQNEEQIKKQVIEAYGRLPLTFVKNDGQINPKVRYYGQGRGTGVYFTAKEVVFAFVKPAARHDRSQVLAPVALRDADAASAVRKDGGMALSLEFLGANPKVRVAAQDKQAGTVNYFIGNDPASWRTDLATYREVIYKEVWPGVEAAFRDEAGRLKYEFRLQPGTKVEAVRLAYNGAGGLSLNDAGNLLIKTPAGVLSDVRPTSYQMIDGRKVPVQSRFALKPGKAGQNIFGFAVAGYDPTYPLVIDPGLIYSTYVGSNGPNVYDSGPDDGYGIRVDANGNAYVIGTTERDSFPVTGRAFDKKYNGSIETFVLKLDATGSALIFSTYLGGAGGDFGEAIALDASGNAYVAVSTSSADMPVTAGAYQTTFRGVGDAYVAKLSADGSELLFGTYFGGSNYDSVEEIALDSGSNVYLAGGTVSVDFPTSVYAFRRTSSGGGDTYVAELSATLSSLHDSTYLGGSGDDFSGGIAVDAGGNAYVTGYTYSTDFPITSGAFDTSANGNLDVFVTKLNASVSALVYSTYLGGSGSEYGQGIAVDAGGNAYAVGYTQSPEFPTTSGAFDTSANGGLDVFVSKLAPNGSSLVYSTFLGGVVDDTGYAIVLDANGNAYVTGGTDSVDFPITPETAVSATQSGNTDVFVSKLAPNGASLLYSTFLGGSFFERAHALALDTLGQIYVTGVTGSSDFPTTPGAFDTTHNGVADVFVSKLVPGATAPDLVITAVSGPNSARRGEYITVSTTVANQGTASTGGFDLTIYLSVDATITTDDIKRATVSVADMAPGESRTFSTDFLIQGSTAPGTYYLGAIADETNVVVESNEFNNARAGNTIKIR